LGEPRSAHVLVHVELMRASVLVKRAKLVGNCVAKL
jgi:hypothetical protein